MKTLGISYQLRPNLLGVRPKLSQNCAWLARHKPRCSPPAHSGASGTRTRMHSIVGCRCSAGVLYSCSIMRVVPFAGKSAHHRPSAPYSEHCGGRCFAAHEANAASGTCSERQHTCHAMRDTTCAATDAMARSSSAVREHADTPLRRTQIQGPDRISLVHACLNIIASLD